MNTEHLVKYLAIVADNYWWHYDRLTLCWQLDIPCERVSRSRIRLKLRNSSRGRLSSPEHTSQNWSH